jgi:hypothetical protein
MGRHAGFQTATPKPISVDRSKARSTLIKSQQDPVLQASVIETRTVQLQGRKKIEHKIVGPAGFNANANAIPHGTGQTDLIHHQLQLEHLLVEASGMGSPVEAAAQQHAQPPTL